MAGTKGAKWGVDDEVLAVLRSSPSPLTVREVMVATGRSKHGVQNQLRALYIMDRVIRSGRGGQQTPWRYSLVTENDSRAR